MAVGMTKFYKKKLRASKKVTPHDLMALESRVRTELRANAYDAANNHVVLTEGQVFAWQYLVDHYKKHNSKDIFGQICYWGAWSPAAARPGETCSYTHISWSAASLLVLFVGLMITLYLWGQLAHEEDDTSQKGKPLTTHDMESGVTRPTQVIGYKFRALSIIAFGIQVLSGVSCAIDFVTLGMDELKPTNHLPYAV
eukprot:942453_1